MEIKEFEKKQAQELREFIEKQKHAAKVNAEREERRKRDRDAFTKFREETIDEIQKSYEFSQRISEIIFDKAWEDGHSSGMGEVRVYALDYADFVEEVLNNY